MQASFLSRADDWTRNVAWDWIRRTYSDPFHRHLVMVVDPRPTYLHSKVSLIKEVLPKLWIVSCTSLNEAEQEYFKQRSRFVMLVIDAAYTTDGIESGEQFVTKNLLRANYPAPYVILTTRMGDDRSRSQDHLDGVAFVKDSSVSREVICAAISKWSILAKEVSTWGDRRPVPLNSNLLKGNRGADQRTEAQKAEVQSLENQFNQLRKAQDEYECVQVIHGLDSWLSALKPSSRTTSLGVFFSSSCRAISSSMEQIRMSNPHPFAVLNLLEAELIWRVRPVDALYLLLDSIRIYTRCGEEPLGSDSEDGYYVAIRIRAQMSLWGRVRSWRMLPNPDSILLWRKLLRDAVKRAAKELRGSPSALIKVEREMRELFREFVQVGNGPAVVEIEARLCEVRKHRLPWYSRPLWWFLGVTSDYGNSAGALLRCCFLCVVVFAILYSSEWTHFANGSLDSHAVPKWGVVGEKIGPALYYSVVTFTTLGDSTNNPAGLLTKTLTVFEVVLGYVAFGLVVSLISSKLRPR